MQDEISPYRAVNILLREERRKAKLAYEEYRSIMRYINELERRYELPTTPIEKRDSTP